MVPDVIRNAEIGNREEADRDKKTEDARMES